MTHYFKGTTFADVYSSALDHILKNPDFVTKPRGYKINECMNVSLEIEDPTQNLFTNPVRSVPEDYIKKEILLYLAGTRDATLYADASKFWNRVKNDDNTVNSAYGDLIFNRQLVDGRSQFDWAYDSLVSDKDSRQAVIFFNRPEFQYPGVKDFVCTFNIVFHIRDNKLYSKISMRSNDIFRGTISDIPFFTLLHMMMYKKLKNNAYPDLEVGSFTHEANSLHIYHNLVSTSDIDKITEMLDCDFESYSMPFPDHPELFIMSDRVMKLACSGIIDNDGLTTDNDKNFWKWLTSVHETN